MPLSHKSRISARLKRLVDSSICPAEDAIEYAAELKQLANEVADVRRAKDEEKFFKALGDETRLRILKLLNVREMCVCEMMVALDLTQPTASHHLNILENVGLVKDRKEGKWVFYSVAKPGIIEQISEIKLL